MSVEEDILRQIKSDFDCMVVAWIMYPEEEDEYEHLELIKDLNIDMNSYYGVSLILGSKTTADLLQVVASYTDMTPLEVWQNGKTQ